MQKRARKNVKKVYFIHPTYNTLEKFLEYLSIDDPEICEQLVWSPEKPDYLFVSEHIYKNEQCFREFCRYRKDKNSIKVFHAGECVAPDLNLFDYAIVFDRDLRYEDRVVHQPMSLFFKKGSKVNEITTKEEARALLPVRGFCNFIYSNALAHEMRDRLFYEIAQYKPVDSLGKHLRNKQVPKLADDWFTDSVLQKGRYKFSIASENAQYKGYVSEKILSSFQAHTIPIYWGDPDITREWNPEAFIDVRAYDNFEALRERIRQIDEDDDLWAEIVSRPWKTPEQMQHQREEEEAYRQFMRNVFLQPLEAAKRAPEGAFPQQYGSWFQRPFDQSTLTKIRGHLANGTLKQWGLWKIETLKNRK